MARSTSLQARDQEERVRKESSTTIHHDGRTEERSIAKWRQAATTLKRATRRLRSSSLDDTVYPTADDKFLSATRIEASRADGKKTSITGGCGGPFPRQLLRKTFIVAWMVKRTLSANKDGGLRRSFQRTAGLDKPFAHEETIFIGRRYQQNEYNKQSEHVDP